MKIALAQLNYTIGDFEKNTQKIIQHIRRARKEKANLVIFSELAVCGYPPLDLLEHKHFIEASEKAIRMITAECQGIAAIVGGPSLNMAQQGKNLYNAAFFLANGEVQQIVRKTLLPTYDIFDEYRYFEQNKEFSLVRYKGYNIAITICEDMWFNQPILTGFGKNRLYSVDPVEELAKNCPDLIINIAASPFSYMHSSVKREILSVNAERHKIPVLYLNQVGAQTELIFDGGSMVMDAKGRVMTRMKWFEEDFALTSMERILTQTGSHQEFAPGEKISLIHDALLLGIRDYFGKMGFKSAVVGLSGGIDSAVTITLAARALGASNLVALMMPSRYSSDHSVNDAVALARKLGVAYHTIPIQQIFDQFLQVLDPIFRKLPQDLTEENIQARIRGNLLMAFSNKFGNLLLNTSNKSEAAVGYGTLYGDMSGGLSVLGDVYKTDVYQLAEFINREEEVIPHNTLVKPPSAELRPDQKDSDSLPDYEVLDQVLFQYIELKRSVTEMVADGMDKALVEKTVRMVNQNEYKRYQTPPVLRVSSKAFGSGRRMPLVAKF